MSAEPLWGPRVRRRSHLTDASPRALGLRLVIGYKLVRGSVELALAVTGVVLSLRGPLAGLRTAVSAIQEHLTAAWSLRLAGAIARFSTPHFLRVAALAFLMSGLFSLAEGVCLRRGYRFAPWLVVIATSLFLPFELIEIAARLAVGRVLLFVANLAVVAILVRHARRRVS